jgi:hypothetical protein
MNRLLGSLQTALADSNADGYLIFGLCVFLTVLMFLCLIAVAAKEPNRQAATVKRRLRQ